MENLIPRWFGTSWDSSSGHPQLLPNTAKPPPVLVESIYVDGYMLIYAAFGVYLVHINAHSTAITS